MEYHAKIVNASPHPSHVSILNHSTRHQPRSKSPSMTSNSVRSFLGNSYRMSKLADLINSNKAGSSNSFALLPLRSKSKKNDVVTTTWNGGSSSSESQSASSIQLSRSRYPHSKASDIGDGIPSLSVHNSKVLQAGGKAKIIRHDEEATRCPVKYRKDGAGMLLPPDWVDGEHSECKPSQCRASLGRSMD